MARRVRRNRIGLTIPRAGILTKARFRGWRMRKELLRMSKLPRRRSSAFQPVRSSPMSADRRSGVNAEEGPLPAKTSTAKYFLKRTRQSATDATLDLKPADRKMPTECRYVDLRSRRASKMNLERPATVRSHSSRIAHGEAPAWFGRQSEIHMNNMLIGALALSLVGGSMAVAQPYDGNHQGGYQGRGDHRDENNGDRGYYGRRYNHGGRTVCSWRHHHRVCYRRHW
jgi:hypothetical protein